MSEHSATRTFLLVDGENILVNPGPDEYLFCWQVDATPGPAWSEEKIAIAKFIVLACNAHDALLEACEGALMYMRTSPSRQSVAAYHQLQAAIAAAEPPPAEEKEK